MERVKKNGLLHMNAADLIAWITRLGGGVYATGLAQLSLYPEHELIAMGWYESRAAQRLYELNNAGVWAQRTNASGLLTESNSAVISANTQAGIYNKPSATVRASTTSATTLDAMWPRTLQLPCNTDGAGTFAAAVLYTAAGAFYPVVRLKRLLCSVADADTELVITVTGGALVGPASIHVTVVAGVVLELGSLLYNLTDGSTIHFAIANGPANSTNWLEYEYWSET